MVEPAARARVLPFAVYMAFIVIADGLQRIGLDAERLRYLYLVKIIAVLALLWHQRRFYSELHESMGGWSAILLAVGSGLLVLVLWVHLDWPWMQLGTAAGFDPRQADGQLDWLLVTGRIAGAALVVPVMEELFWRSFLMRWVASTRFLSVDPRQVGWFPFVVSALLFGIEHHLWFAGVVAGVVYGGIYCYSRKLWPAIVAHAVTNGALGGWIVATGSWTYW